MKSITCINCGHIQDCDEIVAVKSEDGYVWEGHYKLDCSNCFAVHDIHMYPKKKGEKQ